MKVQSHSDLVWLAGLLEGEGCFITARHPSQRPRPTISLQMTDEDVVNRAALIMETPSVKRYPWPGKKDSFRTRLTGEPAAECMLAVRPHMGERRGAKIDEVIEEAKTVWPEWALWGRLWREAHRGFGSNVQPKRVVR